MKNLFNNMDSSEIGRILEMHKKQGHSLSEQESLQQKMDRLGKSQSDKDALRAAADASNAGSDLDSQGYKRGAVSGADDDARPSKYGIKIPKVINIDGSLFKNGIANIDKNNSKYKEAIAALKKLSSNMSVNIIGGASDVGTKQGYDNQKLAMLRATNFIKAAKSDGVKVVMNPSGKVGKNTVKDSPGAEAEQFVKIDFTKGGGFKPEEAVDATRVDNKKNWNGIDGGNKQTGKRYKVCLRGLSKQELDYILITYPGKIVSQGPETPLG